MPSLKLPIFILLLLVSQKEVKAQDILKDSIKHEGLYTSFLSFRLNQPDLVGDIQFIKNSKNNIKKVLFKKIGSSTYDTLGFNKLSKKYWGFSNDNIAYINTSSIWNTDEERIPVSVFYPVFQYGHNILILAETISSNTIVMGGVVGGAIGAGIVSALTASQLKTKEEAITSLSSTSRIITINQQTGKSRLVNPININTLLGVDSQLWEEFHEMNENTRAAEKYVLYLDFLIKLNEKKVPVFEEEKNWSKLYLVKKREKKNDEQLKVLLNDRLFGILDNSVYIDTVLNHRILNEICILTE